MMCGERDALGVIRYTYEAVGEARRERRPQPTIMKGYELLVSAARGVIPLNRRMAMRRANNFMGTFSFGSTQC